MYQLYLLIFHIIIATLIHAFVSRSLHLELSPDATNLRLSLYHINHARTVASVDTTRTLPGARVPDSAIGGFSFRGATPNSGKKRRGTPSLSRTTASSSHGVKMAEIFHDAAVTLQEVKKSRRQTSPNTTRLRTPTSQARSTPFGAIRQDGKSTLLGVKTPTPNGLNCGSDTGMVLRTSQALEAPRESAFTTPRPFMETPSDTPSAQSGGETPGACSGRVLTPPEIPYGLTLPLQPVFKDDPMNVQDVDIQSKKSISSGFPTPHRRHPSQWSSSSSQSITYPTLRNPDGIHTGCRRQSPTSDILDCHSTHGVPLVIPIPNTEPEDNTHRSQITSWLNTVVEASSSSTVEERKTPPPLPPRPLNHPHQKPNSSPKYPPIRSISHASSNKENHLPQSPSSSLIRSPVRRSNLDIPNPYQPPYRSTPSPTKRFLHPLTPTNLLRQSPKRREGVPAPRDDAAKGGDGFEIYDELKELSPDVEVVRKGRGRGMGVKRGRCVSYWDDDIWPRQGLNAGDGKGNNGEDEGVGEERDGRRVLGEKEGSVELCRDKGFVEGVEGAEFGFRA